MVVYQRHNKQCRKLRDTDCRRPYKIFAACSFTDGVFCILGDSLVDEECFLNLSLLQKIWTSL
eukprot:1695831-Amphidinium_carterae.1